MLGRGLNVLLKSKHVVVHSILVAFVNMSFVQIKIEYDYYSNKRITPIFLNEEDIISMKYNDFKARILKDVPHLSKIASLRLTIQEDGLEVDLSQTYFSHQMKGILAKSKTISINAIEFDSPIVKAVDCEISTQTSTAQTQSKKPTVQSNVRRSLNLFPKAENPLESITSNSATINDKPKSLPIASPLERYAIKQRNTVRDIESELEQKRSDLVRFDDRLKRASEQNAGHLSVCSNCHLKLGHTKKICSWSPCQSAYSCGFLSRHSSEKSERTALDREVSRIQNKLTSAKKEMENAGRAAAKVTNSASKKIEDIIIKELPNRYVSNGLRNWISLNKDVAVLQKHLKGMLPSRDNVLKILYEFVIDDEDEERNFEWDLFKVQGTDHRMKSHKRLLTEEYAIKFPPAKKYPSSASNSKPNRQKMQEETDFKLALKIQREDKEESPEVEVIEVKGSPFIKPDFSDEDEATAVSSEREDVLASHSGENLDENLDDIQFQADAAAALLHLSRR